MFHHNLQKMCNNIKDAVYVHRNVTIKFAPIILLESIEQLQE